MAIFQFKNGFLTSPRGDAFQCVHGKGGLTHGKREGDGATPIGRWPVREVLYRPDRVSAPKTALPCTELHPNDGWCDDPKNVYYNQRIILPFSDSHEELWRQDGLYDLIVPLGYNDDSPRPGLGSAIFLHVARPDWGPTEGCLAVKLTDLQKLITQFSESDLIDIMP